MARLFTTQDKDFASQFHAFAHARRGSHADVDKTVTAIMTDVQHHGDRALIRYTRQFDHADFDGKALQITSQECADASAQLAEKEKRALRHAIQRITAYHERQKPQDDFYQDHEGIQLGMRWRAIENVGLYVPGGTAAYPSSVIMNAVPALVAGVKRLIMAVPAPHGYDNPLVLATAHQLGIHAVFRIGGAQAIAAMAYGTERIAKVDKIVGPGNQYVAAAKKLVFGSVGIDMIAGPSEVLIVADETAQAEWIASDVLAQAEHDPNAQAIVITNSQQQAEDIETSIARQLTGLSRQDIARESWHKHGAVIIVTNIEQQAPALVDALAPEHLQLAVANPTRLMDSIRYAGAIFLGHYTPEAVGDYIAGPNHVLPTSGSARFSSGLSVYDFLVRNTTIHCDEKQLHRIAGDAITLAEAEGLDAHAQSIRIRKHK